MSKSLDDFIQTQTEARRLLEISPDEARVGFEKLAIEVGDPELIEYLKGKDIGRHVLYMIRNGDAITYPPILEALQDENSVYVPSDTPLNKGLFEALGVEVAKPSDIEESFLVPSLSLTVNLIPVPTAKELTIAEKIGLGERRFNAPFLRASI